MSKYFPHQTLNKLIVNAKIVKPRKMENRIFNKIFSEQRRPAAGQRSNHLHRVGGRQRRDPAVHREGAGDRDGGGAHRNPSHQVRGPC